MVQGRRVRARRSARRNHALNSTYSANSFRRGRTRRSGRHKWPITNDLSRLGCRALGTKEPCELPGNHLPGADVRVFGRRCGAIRDATSKWNLKDNGLGPACRPSPSNLCSSRYCCDPGWGQIATFPRTPCCHEYRGSLGGQAIVETTYFL